MTQEQTIHSIHCAKYAMDGTGRMRADKPCTCGAELRAALQQQLAAAATPPEPGAGEQTGALKAQGGSE